MQKKKKRERGQGQSSPRTAGFLVHENLLALTSEFKAFNLEIRIKFFGSSVGISTLISHIFIYVFFFLILRQFLLLIKSSHLLHLQSRLLTYKVDKKKYCLLKNTPYYRWNILNFILFLIWRRGVKLFKSETNFFYIFIF